MFLFGYALVLACLQSAGCDGGSGTTDGAQQGGEAGSHSDGNIITNDGSGPFDGAQGGAPVGEPCDKDTDCDQSLELICFKEVGGMMGLPKIVFPNGYCSKGCSGGDETIDCGEKGSCAQMGMGGSSGTSGQLAFCARICNSVADCRQAEGYKCQKLLPFFPGYCSPP